MGSTLEKQAPCRACLVRAPRAESSFDGEASGALAPAALQPVVMHRGGAKFKFHNAYKLEFLAKAQLNELLLGKPCNKLLVYCYRLNIG